jgi:putative tryptophan/tyrosine transport system substrate-binding protein
MRRRDFIAGLGSAAASPMVARAQQPALPVVGVLNGSTADASPGHAAGFRKGLSETGYVEGQNVTVEYHWLEGQYDRLPALMADPVRRRVAVIAAFGDLRSLPKRRPRRSRLFSASVQTRSKLVLSPAWPGRAAPRPA